MTNKEAIELLAREMDSEQTTSTLAEALRMGIEALELIDPEKPTWVLSDEATCPQCGDVLDDGEDPCLSCGKRIDWT